MSIQTEYTTAEQSASSPFEKFPKELRARRQWVVWRAEKNDKGKLTKVPYRALGQGKAASNDPSTWATFAQALTRFERGDVDGIGYVFAPDDHFCGVDVDHCLDEAGQLTPFAREIVEGCQSYTEVSPSGRGVHIIVKAQAPHGINRPDIELYSEGRYFTVTGRHLAGTPLDIRERQELIDYLVAEYSRETPQQAPAPAPAPAQPAPVLRFADDPHDDATLVDHARRAANGVKFSTLFDRGDLTGYKSQSEAELALCSLLAYWTGGDAARVDSLYRQSALYRPEKWDTPHRAADRATYGEMTIEKALQQRGGMYTPQTTGNLAPAPLPDNGDDPPAAPLRLRLADVWERDLIRLGRPPETPPEREYMLDFAAVPSVNLWTGLPGGKKSLLLADAALAEAAAQLWLPRKGDDSGIPMFGDIQGQGRPVLWIDYDMGRDLSEERFYAMARYRGIDDLSTIPLHLLSVSAPMDLYSLQHADELAELIHRLGAKFVVIDTLIDVKGAAKENEDSMGVVFSNLRRIAQHTRCCLNVIHHPAKNGSPDAPYRGFSGIAGKLDLGVTLAKRGYEASEPVDVSFFKVRGAPPKPFSAMLQIETHPADWRTLWRASFVAIAPPANVVGEAAIRDTFRQVLEDSEGIGKTDLIKKVHLKLFNQKISRAQVEAMYYTLLSENAIAAEPTGEKNKLAHRWEAE